MKSKCLILLCLDHKIPSGQEQKRSVAVSLGKTTLARRQCVEFKCGMQMESLIGIF